MSLLSWLYALVVITLAVYGFNLLLLVGLAALAWLRSRPISALPEEMSDADWPTVLVQLPLYNERHVVERLVDAAAALDYPADKLLIQVLDDSTDDTAALARARVIYHRLHGRPVVYEHRAARAGYKAGALAYGLTRVPPARSELVAVFDADFIPPPDFLRCLAPVFFGDDHLGLAQGRWEHLNADQNLLTRAEALALDSFFSVEQMARSHSGLFFNFNGSAGVWRRAAIEDAGGWQSDTLAEDLDLSYRAQLKGWRLSYWPLVSAPAELTPSIMAFKRQQFRWAKGSFQVLRKLGSRLVAAPLPLFRKFQALLHLSGYLPHPLMVLSLLLSLPLVALHTQNPLNWGLFSLAGLGLPLAALLSQMILRRDWPQRLAYYPSLVLVGIGLAVTSTHALWEAFFGRAQEFLRTPKFAAAQQRGDAYALSADWTTWAEMILALYAFATGLLAVERMPGLAPFLFIYALGFGYTAILGFWQSGGVQTKEWLMLASRNK